MIFKIVLVFVALRYLVVVVSFRIIESLIIKKSLQCDKPARGKFRPTVIFLLQRHPAKEKSIGNPLFVFLPLSSLQRPKVDGI